ncbi:segregation/condensation protein A [Ochrobactrum sp. MYb15]|uniref:Segregation and condensation protein A n=2 Tax=Brucella/Ochrobactrum group TaxID=2826938 RepID=A0A643F4I7_9HYPH|nr:MULTISPECIES: ScpA family protein [Brucella]PQZ52042.1 segregation/condensation protein A [Ochrobactrum sp. MYb19]PRA62733.1 segregation/condensation protein A [Ochrobactrum sp. MYb18]PRA76613.1 segregation/condensation protein A [Brucella thiophenivorans]PRA93754.1 segregation/condensation protein A [Ochrobactrum sp. MYb14]PRA98620.1 segregation/condensation protein A [Ochrobactrum sp. MYb15]TCQ82789.1 condensin subunit ScpA [Ochrobactrum sp. BH3]
MAGSETNTNGKDGTNVPMDALWQGETDRAESEPSLLIDVQGFEGPLDLLLHLARNQRVDLSRISVLALAEQYLGFVEQAQALSLELAADYLVMAAWLAYLKSKLLIPKQQDDDGATGEELIASLQFRLKRLEAMRDAAAKLVNRNRLGRDVFARGMPELVVVDRSSQFSATLYELLTAYASQRQRQAVSHVQIEKRAVWSLKEARVALVRLMGSSGDWVALDHFLINYALTPQERASALASSFAASLELVREGKLEVRQNAPFEPIYMRVAGGLSELDEDENV